MEEFSKHSSEKDRNNRRAHVVALLLVCSLVSGIVGGRIAMLNISETNTSGINQTVVLKGKERTQKMDTINVDTGEVKTASQVYAQNVNATVGITTSITTNFWGYQSTAAASGSGFIVSDNGYIITNYHVVEGSDRISVTLFNSDSYEAKLIGFDQSNDIAVLKIEATGLNTVVFGDSEKLQVGEDVLAIGNPLGELTFSLTAGKISAKDREVTFSSGVMMNLLQTDCAINSGNSGGALFNLYGEVVGVTNAKFSNSTRSGASIDNIGFAIPINTARTIMESIIEKGYVSKPYIGITVTDVTVEHQLYGLPIGATVREIAADSPAMQAGIEIGDIITHVDATPIEGSRALLRILRGCTVGQTLEFTVYRRGETLEIDVTADEQIQKQMNS